ncbi:hypothetical protein [Ketobacter alkanivorans]|uniref:Pyrrolo-quinoline quinone n=1 Tax=Ketobacter alkanivorans TaxID=1917421 RepID=A0A2K9LIM6_9GAMM|nr:hypothetical protein [Ketobacter alkanivorans]AUM12122.1 hypothetical protein Kalk_06725 [Ketobacter alkanivorans]
MNKTIKILLLVIIVVLVYIAYRLGWSVADPLISRQINNIHLTPNQIAANGPLPGEVSLYAKELSCQQNISTPGYYSSLNGAEISDAQRSGLFPCASFLGSHDGNNTVYAWRSVDDYPGISYINNRKPGELFIVGGEYPTLEDPNMAGPFIAKADASTGKEIWRTYVDNLNASKRWIGNANLNILENGKIAFAWSNQIILLDTDSGQILKHNTLPTGDAPANDANFKHMTVAPDGTLIMKDQTRPAGCTLQGTMAIIKCAGEQGMTQPNSILVAVDPDTLEILAEFLLPEPATAPHIISMFEDKIAIYVGMDKSVRRYFWEPTANKFSADESWALYPMQEGQTTATAPTLVGDWIAVQLNGIGSSTIASSIVVANLKDSAKKQIVFPFGELKKGEWSFAPPKCGADPENSMIYSADMGVGKVAGVKLNQETGELDVRFVLDNATTTFQPVIGPADKRILLLTNMEKNVAKEPIKAALFTGNYKEQLTWRNAATGEIIAESDFFEPLTINSLTPPGFGGRFYFPTAVGKGFYVLQVGPARTK